ncbi:MAG: HEPN domain-containing protein [Candidatus Micrarchaeota archaeon]
MEKVEADPKRAEELMVAAARDIGVAEDNLKISHSEWALAISYNAMLSAGMALMASKGYRPFTEAHHLAAVQFCAAVLPKESSGLVARFNRYRVRRHDVVYGEAGSVGEDEARRAVESAKAFIGEIKRAIAPR